MGGGLMQLVAYGAQDVYLTKNRGSATFWGGFNTSNTLSDRYKTIFSKQIEYTRTLVKQNFNEPADFGRKLTCTIGKHGDLAYRTYLQVTLPEISQDLKNEDGAVYARWLDFPGLQLISQVEVEIGGQKIDRQYGDWMHIWDQLTLSKEKECGYKKIIGQTTELTYITDPITKPHLPQTTLYVPLQFWFNRNPGLALPLIALQYHEVKINLDLRPIDECLWAVNSVTGTDPFTKVKKAFQQSLVDGCLIVEYIHLSSDIQQQAFINKSKLTYLIEQLQFFGDESVGSSSNKIKLNFNHPCKELVWVVQRDDFVEYDCPGAALNVALGAQPFNYTDALDALPNAVKAFGGRAADANAISGTVGELDEVISSGNTGVSDAGTFVLAETALDMHCWGENPVVTAKLQLNGQDRFSEREGTYFDLVQPYQHHTRSPDTGINVYSFALRPEEHQPSGTCNFSRIDNATLQLVLSSATIGGTNTANVRVYATNYNLLCLNGGFARVMYSSDTQRDPLNKPSSDFNPHQSWAEGGTLSNADRKAARLEYPLPPVVEPWFGDPPV